MSLQNIIDNATSITVERTKVTGSTISRSGRIKTGLLAGNQPFAFTVAYRPMQVYADVRDVLEEIDRLDTYYSDAIDIGSSNPGLSWITEYRGDLSPAQIAQINCTTTVSGSTINLDVSAVTGALATDYVLRKGDFVQFDSGYLYPYTVTADVQRGAGSTITVNLNRPVITQTGYTIDGSKGIVVGNAVTWTVKMIRKPTYTVLPSRYVEFTSEFALIEVIED